MFHSNTSVGDLKTLCRKPQYAKYKDRMQAVVLRRTGKTYRDIAKNINRSYDFVRKWNIRFKTSGASGLVDKKYGPDTKSLTIDELEKLKMRIVAGPTKQDACAVFTRSDIKKIIKNEFGYDFSVGLISKLLNKMGLSIIKPRPIHIKKDMEQVKSWQQDFPLL